MVPFYRGPVWLDVAFITAVTGAEFKSEIGSTRAGYGVSFARILREIWPRYSDAALYN